MSIVYTTGNHESKDQSVRSEIEQGLVILGMHRSGTSALAGTLNALGFHAGPCLLPADKSNKRGYFEESSIVSANEQLLLLLDRTWDDERPILTENFSHPTITLETNNLALHISSLFRSTGPWLIKDPRISRLLPVWRRVFQILGTDPIFVLCVRHPAEVAASLWCRDRIPEHRANLLYALHLLEGERESRGSRRFVVNYKDLLSDWQSAIEPLLRALSGQSGDQISTRGQSVSEFLCNSLQNHGPSWRDYDTCTLNKERESTLKTSRNTDKESIFQAGSNIDYLSGELSGSPREFAIEVYNMLTSTDPFPSTDLLDHLSERVNRYLQAIKPWLDGVAFAEKHRTREMDYLRYRLLEEDENYMQSYGKKSESVIYWQDNVTDYTEAKRLVAPIHFGRRQVVQFQWTSPIEPIKKIRWDITDRAALIEVFDCILVNQAYEITWRWNVSDELFTSMSDHLKVLRKSRKDQILGLLATGNDPYIEMCIPIDLVSTIDMNWQLLIDCKIDIPTRAIAFLL